MKKILFVIATFAMGMAVMPSVHATSPDSIETLDELKSCLGGSNSVCTLNKDIMSDNYINVGRDVTIDLNNHTITISGSGNNVHFGLYIANANNVVIKNGSITSENVTTSTGFPFTITLNNSNLKLENTKVLGQDKALPISLYFGTSSLTVDSLSEVSSKGNAAITGYSKEGTSTINVYGKVSESGTFSAIDGAKDATETIINVYDGATISSDNGAGIFERGKGSINVYGGNISGFSGIITVDGNLNVTGGNIKGTGSGIPDTSENADGSVKDNGSAIFVLPDANKNVKVDIKDGTLTSLYNSALSAPGNNENLAISISGGNFNGSDDKGAIDVAGKTSFISGGKFSSNVGAYLTAGLIQDVHGKVATKASLKPGIPTQSDTTTDKTEEESKTPIAPESEGTTGNSTTDIKNPDTADNFYSLVSMLTISATGLFIAFKKIVLN